MIGAEKLQAVDREGPSIRRVQGAVHCARATRRGHSRRAHLLSRWSVSVTGKREKEREESFSRGCTCSPPACMGGKTEPLGCCVGERCALIGIDSTVRTHSVCGCLSQGHHQPYGDECDHCSICRQCCSSCTGGIAHVLLSLGLGQ